jgi:ribosomal protein S18 acetylase RimI-like enzyme
MGKPFGNLESTWFVFYVEIDEAHRGRGLGRAAMQAAEDWTKEHDGTRVALNVFGPNVVARSLYDSLGYQVMATAMFKDL